MAKKIFISGAITGDPDYKAKFAEAEMHLQQQGYVVVNPAKLSEIMDPDAFSWEDYIRVTVVMLSACDSIYMLQGWRDSKGAREEELYAWVHNKEIIQQN